jgi:hypothetical protein
MDNPAAIIALARLDLLTLPPNFDYVKAHELATAFAIERYAITMLAVEDEVDPGDIADVIEERIRKITQKAIIRAAMQVERYDEDALMKGFERLDLVKACKTKEDREYGTAVYSDGSEVDQVYAQYEGEKREDAVIAEIEAEEKKKKKKK